MIWPYLPLIAAYLVVAWAVRQCGLSLAGESSAGRNAAPVVAVFWPLAVWLLLIIAVVALVEAGFDVATGWMRRAERDG